VIFLHEIPNRVRLFTADRSGLGKAEVTTYQQKNKNKKSQVRFGLSSFFLKETSAKIMNYQ